MKKLYQLFLIATATLLAGCSTSQTGVYVGNFSNSECLNKTRSAKAPTTKLKLTRNGKFIDGEFLGYQANCSHGQLSVECQQQGSRLNISVSEDHGDGNGMTSNCLCPINIYFTVYDVEGENFQIFVNEKEMGNIMLKENDIALFDTYAIDYGYEKGIEYPPVLFHYYYYSEISDAVGDTTWSLSYTGADNAIHGICQNFYLPCDAEKINLEADIDKTGSLVITSSIDGKVADGKPAEGCMRRATVYFLIYNALKDSYHIKVNPHEVTVKDADGTEHVKTVYDFEGDLKRGSSVEVKP